MDLRISRMLVAFAYFTGLAASVFAADKEKPTKADLVKLGKGATALVEYDKIGVGSAFCIHKSGLFVTNDHVIAGAENKEIQLILDSSLKTQRVLKAKVVRVDKSLDLALLRAEEPGELVSLTLGSIKDVVELADLIAFGFPFGKNLSTEKGEYPAISVNAGNVTALRMKAKELDRIQMDIGLNPGNSGGAVIDDHGRVVGIVVSGITSGARINFAIPVSHLSRFLQSPDIQFDPPALTAQNLTKPQEFKARSTPLIPGATEESNLKLILRAGDGEPREFPMKKRNGAWTATAVASSKLADVYWVTATIVARAGNDEVARIEKRIVVRDSSQIPKADPSKVIITPPDLADEKTVKLLPEPFADVQVGGAGRYLIFHLPKMKKLAIFDINVARVTKYIPVDEEAICYAAGLDSVVIGFKKSGKLERWSLTTFQLEKSAPPPFKEEIANLCLGHSSHGPMVVNGYFLDLISYRQLSIVDESRKDRIWGAGDVRFPSGDGTVFGGWETSIYPFSSTTFVLEGDVIKTHNFHISSFCHAIPGPDGKHVFTAIGTANRSLARSREDSDTYGYCLPAVRGDYFLSLTTAQQGKGGTFTVHTLGLKEPIAKFDHANHGIAFDGWDREKFGPWKRVYFIPEAKVIVVLPPIDDQIVLYKFDPAAALEKSGKSYLFVTSQAPQAAKAGTKLTYPITVKAKHPKVEFKLNAGPKGMELSPTGQISWAIPEEVKPGDHEVIVSIKDGSVQEIFHTFTVRVVK